MHDLVYDYFPKANKIKLVMDNLNTHEIASLYKTYAPEKARYIASKLIIYKTPVHGSWFNMAEIELSVLSSQCINNRIGSLVELQDKVSIWKEGRNNSNAKIDWQFTTQDARIKLKALYPALQPG